MSLGADEATKSRGGVGIERSTGSQATLKRKPVCKWYATNARRLHAFMPLVLLFASYRATDLNCSIADNSNEKEKPIQSPRNRKLNDVNYSGYVKCWYRVDNTRTHK